MDRKRQKFFFFFYNYLLYVLYAIRYGKVTVLQSIADRKKIREKRSQMDFFQRKSSNYASSAVNFEGKNTLKKSF